MKYLNHTSRFLAGRVIIITAAMVLTVTVPSQAGSAETVMTGASGAYAVSDAALPLLHGGEAAAADDDGIRVGPNPFTPNNNGFNDFVTFDFTSAITGPDFIIRIFDMNGRRVRTLRTNGRSEITWDGSDSSGSVLKPGIYLYIIESNNSVVRRGSVTLAL